MTYYDVTDACKRLPRLGLLQRFDRVVSAEPPITGRWAHVLVYGVKGGIWSDPIRVAYRLDGAEDATAKATLSGLESLSRAEGLIT